jgi:UDP-2,3-diacylglucosamine hydrolase
MRAVFLSDVHLKRHTDPGYERCMQFFMRLQGRGAKSGDEKGIVIDLLVIAGDFFDFWFERGGRIYPEFRTVVERLVELKQSGVRVCLCEGNHDFFLGDYFSRTLGIEVYPEEARFTLDGQRCLVSHGDTVDRENRRYLALRRLLRSPFAYRMQRIVPLAWMWWIARLSSKVSRDAFADATNRLKVVMHHYAAEKFREGFDAVIFGHCHTPTFREEQIGSRHKYIVTLGDWITHQKYLIFENGRFTQKRFEPEAQHEVPL